MLAIGEANAVSEERTAPWFETRLLTILSNYSLADISNAGEYVLFYLALTRKRMISRKGNAFLGSLVKRV